ncbi:MAG: peptidyl-prolyl cis-trans isomerase, partial [Myxococcales bacterium]|nr:peptidyl-prolyl cis-trans isomerase [Myxococcales bacterium]
GLFPTSRMVPEYAEVAFALEPGQVSEPVRSEKGYYVIKSFGRYEAGPLPFEAVRADLVRQLQGEIFKRGKEQLRKELEERFTIESQVLDDITAYDAARKGGPRP